MSKNKFEVKHPDGRRNVFTKDQWDLLGPDKQGWVKVHNEPDEVKELRATEELNQRKAQVAGFQLEGLLTDQELKEYSPEVWPHISGILSKIQERLPAIINFRVSQQFGTPAPQPAAPAADPEYQAPVTHSPAITEGVQEAAKTAVENQPPVKVVTDGPVFPQPEYDAVKETSAAANTDLSAPITQPTTVGEAAEAEKAAEKAVQSLQEEAEKSNKKPASANKKADKA